MIKKVILLLSLSFVVIAQEMKLKEFHFIFEDDVDFKHDRDYSFGSEIGALFSYSLRNDFFYTNYFSISYAWQFYTPKDIRDSNLIVDDRPYAGYQYVKTSLHRINKDTLHTMTLQLGFIGPATQMQSVQNGFHYLIDAPHANGWEYQLKNEFIVQLNYSYREFIQLSEKQVILPEVGFELGNASIKGYVMAIYRYGDSIENDFSTSLMDNTNYYKIPKKEASHKKWGYALQLNLKTNFIARDIFLDGNTIQNSHSVEKNSFVSELGYGIDIFYKKWSFSYLRKHLTKEFTTQNRYHSYGSLIISRDF